MSETSPAGVPSIENSLVTTEDVASWMRQAAGYKEVPIQNPIEVIKMEQISAALRAHPFVDVKDLVKEIYAHHQVVNTKAAEIANAHPGPFAAEDAQNHLDQHSPLINLGKSSIPVDQIVYFDVFDNGPLTWESIVTHPNRATRDLQRLVTAMNILPLMTQDFLNSLDPISVLKLTGTISKSRQGYISDISPDTTFAVLNGRNRTAAAIASHHIHKFGSPNEIPVIISEPRHIFNELINSHPGLKAFNSKK